MMLVGYVSSERYVALADAIFEFRSSDGEVTTARSTISGAVYADLDAHRRGLLCGLLCGGIGLDDNAYVSLYFVKS